MVGKIRTLGLTGIHGLEVTVESALTPGLPGFEIVGLPDAAVRESRERVRAAMSALSYPFPNQKLVINLAPADVKKEGPVYDVAVMLAVLAATGVIDPVSERNAFIGELSLEGKLRPIRGVLPMALAARRAGIEALFVPAQNAAVATLAEGLTVYAAETAAQILAHLDGQKPLAPTPAWQPEVSARRFPDFADVSGQENVKRALEIAAAGGHNILMSGPPGTGKSMLARRLPSILPDMTRGEALEATTLHSIAGMLSPGEPLLPERPYRAPHAQISAAGLIGGGSNPRPGEVSLAHNGVLFLDEFPEFNRHVLDTHRQPMEDGEVTIARAANRNTFPARFSLVCAMNPCRCGWYGHESGRCTCTEDQVRKYRSRISGPLLDRIDIQIDVQPVGYDDLTRPSGAEPSSVIRERVCAARARQRTRYGGQAGCNAGLDHEMTRTYCALAPDASRLMEATFKRLNMSARTHDRVLRVARTIADLAGADAIEKGHLAEALQYRFGI